MDILVCKQGYGQVSQVNMTEATIYFFWMYEIVHECMHYFNVLNRVSE